MERHPHQNTLLKRYGFTVLPRTLACYPTPGCAGTGHGSKGVRRRRGSCRRITDPAPESQQSSDFFATRPTA
jgi:hypothetical protein